MTERLLWIIVASGVGTFLMRLLPFYWRPSSAPSRVARASRRMLDALGPSAITALLVVSLWPHVNHGLATLGAASAIAGLFGVALARWWWGGLTLPTLFGVICYGLVCWVGA